MLMHVEGEMRLFDEAAPERTQTEERKPFLFFFFLFLLFLLAVFEVMGQIR